MDRKFITNSSQETKKLGENLVPNLGDRRFLALFGDLGSGKTTFVQGFVKGLGIKRRIISPTFIIVRNYELQAKTFYHIDLYRVESQSDVQGLGLEEILNNPQNIVAVEWAEKIKDLLPKKRIELYFETIDENKRRIKLKNYG